MRALHLLVLGLALPLWACAPDPGTAPVPTGADANDPRVVACQRESEAQPSVREVAARRPQLRDAQVQRDRDLKAALVSEMDRCLRREGLRPRGGVQRVIPP